MKRILLIVFSLMFGLSAHAASDIYKPDVRDGDIIFHYSRSEQSQALKEAIGSPYTHMGIIFIRDGKPHVFEAAKTVRLTGLKTWIKQGENDHYVIKRLKEADKYLTQDGLRKLHAVAKTFNRKVYDSQFSWSDEKMYCSELVWKVYERALGLRIGNLEKMRDFNLGSLIVREAAQKRFGTNVPLDETVVSPVSMFNSPLLETVASNP